MKEHLLSLIPPLLEAFRAVGRWIPLGWARRIGEGVGEIAYLVPSSRKQIALENLAIAFPDSTESWRRRTLRSNFRGWGRALFELIVVFAGKYDVIKDSLTIEGLDNLKEALSAGRGAVVVTGHMGNFPLLWYIFLQMGIPSGGIMRIPEHGKMGPWLKETIESFGIKLLPASPRIECVRQTTKSLRAGEMVIINIDINTKRSTGVMIEFFNYWIPTFSGAAVFAQRTRAPLVPMFIVRDGPDRIKLKIHPPIKLERTKDRQKQIHETLTKCSHMLEDAIREHPEEWWWLHRRFRKAQKEPPQIEEAPDVENNDE